MAMQIKKHFWPNGQLSHYFVIINNKIVTAERYDQTGKFLYNNPALFNFKIQNLRYFFWNTANLNDSVEIIDDYM